MIQKKEVSLSEAIAQGAVDSGAITATHYPGAGATPVFNAIKEKISSQESANEKIAYEICLGISYAGKRSICVVKSVGINVLSDSLINSCFTGVNGGLVLVAVDDMYCNFSTNFQDSRGFYELTKTLIFEPSSPQEAYDMTKEAFKISERIDMPIIIRVEKRKVSAMGEIKFEKEKISDRKMKRDIKKWLLHPPLTISQTRNLIHKQNKIQDYVEKSKFNFIKDNKSKEAIILSGSSFSDFEEVKKYDFLKIGTFPIPEQKAKDFIKNHKKIKILEKGLSLIEKEVFRINSHVKIDGQLNKKVKPIFEEGIEDVKIVCRDKTLIKFYRALRKNIPEVTFGDIGGFTKGAFPPCDALDSAVCMGASIGMGIGANFAGVKKVFSVIGDSTFIHSGIPALIEAAAKNIDITIFILDNHGAISTGGQEVYGNLDKIIHSIDNIKFKRLNVQDSDELKIYEEIKEIANQKGVSVFVADFPRNS
jgi:indolepyruvate ferredoxin oxidoreductase alpha subunit